jgi:biotin carboxyl carrier protein
MSLFAKPPSPSLVIASIALVLAIGGGAAFAASKIQTSDIAKQAVTNKKIAKKTIKASRVADNTLGGAQINESKLGSVPKADTAEVAGTGRSTFKDGATQIPAPSTGTVLSLDVPAGSYLFIAKGVLAKAGPTLISCTTAAGNDTDTSLAHIDAGLNNTLVNTVVHTFGGAGTAVFSCNNPAGNPLFVTNAKLTAIPFANLQNTAAP